MPPNAPDTYRLTWLTLAQALLAATPPSALREHVEFRLRTPLRELLRVEDRLGQSTLLLEIEHGTALLLVAEARGELAPQTRRWREQWAALSERLHAEYCAECLAARS